MFYVMYVLAAATTSALFLAAGRRSTCVAATRANLHAATGWVTGAGGITGQPFAGIDAELAVALQRLAPIMTRRQITLDVVTRPDLLTLPNLADILEKLIFGAILYGAPERLLLTAWKCGSGIGVRLIDDIGAAHSDARRNALLGLTDQVIGCGGTLDVEVEPDGSIVTIWLPEEYILI